MWLYRNETHDLITCSTRAISGLFDTANRVDAANLANQTQQNFRHSHVFLE